MRNTFSLVAMGLLVTGSSGIATYWVIENEETAAIAEVFISLLAAITILALPSNTRR